MFPTNHNHCLHCCHGNRLVIKHNKAIIIRQHLNYDDFDFVVYWYNLTQAGTGSLRLSFLVKKWMSSLGVVHLTLNITQGNFCLCSMRQGQFDLCDKFDVTCDELIITLWQVSIYFVTSNIVTSFMLPCKYLCCQACCYLVTTLLESTSFKLLCDKLEVTSWQACLTGQILASHTL